MVEVDDLELDVLAEEVLQGVHDGAVAGSEGRDALHVADGGDAVVDDLGGDGLGDDVQRDAGEDAEVRLDLVGLDGIQRLGAGEVGRDVHGLVSDRRAGRRREHRGVGVVGADAVLHHLGDDARKDAEEAAHRGQRVIGGVSHLLGGVVADLERELQAARAEQDVVAELH